ncbi:MAG: elongation factor G [Ruminococcus callidus]|uniref:elongation factor G n=1 Tax=Ruminococcus callidus TaxID=40519 RepID=UPI0023F04109|nr:elongation factor G [Ruminococcus callidus]MBS6597153.1 elongation factor G [Ruminococcus callidus]
MIIKNIALAGHAGTGKTTLLEALLYQGGCVERMGSVAAGTTVSDAAPEEIKRHSSVYTATGSIMLDGQKINLLDTPGMFDFAGGMVQGISAADCVMITVSGKSGVRVGTKKAYRAAEGKPRMFVVTKLDDENANFYNVLTELKSAFGPSVCPVVVPVIADRKVDSYINLIEMKAYRYDKDGKAQEIPMPTSEVSEKLSYRVDGLIQAFSEAIAETDEELFEKFFSGEEFTQKERVDGIHKGMRDGTITPVACVSAQMLEGVDLLCKEMELLVPEASDEIAALNQNGEEVVLHQSPEEPVCVQVYQTLADPYVGKLSMMRVISGTLKAGAELVNSKTGATEKLNKLFFLCGKKQTETAVAEAGDLVAATKLSANTGDTLCDSSRVVSLSRSSFPTPCYSMAVRPAARGDEAKVAAAIQKILEEDQTLSYQQNPATNEMILSGLGEQHLSAVISKLKADFGVDVVLSVPKIAYRETIRKKVKVQGKYKKQSGGHGQYGDVWIEFEPYPSEELVFEEKVFGGAVPRNFFPAVEKGLQESYTKGVLAGFPVVGVKAILVDGSYHPVDSSEMSFKTAASLAYKEGMKQAEPTLLVPVGLMSVTVPDECTGDIMGDLNKRRGRVLGMNSVEDQGMTFISAEVPLREMADYALQLRQMTQGEGTFSMAFARYEQLPANLVAEVIASALE